MLWYISRMYVNVICLFFSLSRAKFDHFYGIYISSDTKIRFPNFAHFYSWKLDLFVLQTLPLFQLQLCTEL